MFLKQKICHQKINFNYRYQCLKKISYNLQKHCKSNPFKENIDDCQNRIESKNNIIIKSMNCREYIQKDPRRNGFTNDPYFWNKDKVSFTSKNQNSNPKSNNSKEKKTKEKREKLIQQLLNKRRPRHQSSHQTGSDCGNQRLQSQQRDQALPEEENHFQNPKLKKIQSERISSSNTRRQKILSCKIAVKKKGVFPLNWRQYQKMKLCDFFDKDTILSSIENRQGQEEWESRQDLMNFVDELNQS